MANKVIQLVNKDGDNLYPLTGGMAADSVATAMLQDGAVTVNKLNANNRPIIITLTRDTATLVWHWSAVSGDESLTFNDLASVIITSQYRDIKFRYVRDSVLSQAIEEELKPTTIGVTHNGGTFNIRALIDDPIFSMRTEFLPNSTGNVQNLVEIVLNESGIATMDSRAPRYSTSTICRTGEVWIDGKEIYRKTFYFSSLAAAGQAVTQSTVLDNTIGQIIKFEGILVNSTGDWWRDLSYAAVDIDATRSTIGVHTRSGDMSPYSAYVTIYFTGN